MTAELCPCGVEGEWYADNNADRTPSWYCVECEDTRAEFYGCARMVAEGCGCFPEPESCACGCGGTGTLEQV